MGVFGHWCLKRIAIIVMSLGVVCCILSNCLKVLDVVLMHPRDCTLSKSEDDCLQAYKLLGMNWAWAASISSYT